MRLDSIRENYYTHSASLSSVARQLAMAGIAVVWIFAQKQDYGFTLPTEFLKPLAFFVGGLACDLLQYMYASAAWGILNRFKETKHNDEDDIYVSPFINWPTLALFWGKSLSVVLGFGLLLLILI